jgi:hypothetical protein
VRTEAVIDDSRRAGRRACQGPPGLLPVYGLIDAGHPVARVRLAAAVADFAK